MIRQIDDFGHEFSGNGRILVGTEVNYYIVQQKIILFSSTRTRMIDKVENYFP